MKKRILALALAGTTAFSVFGALNVSAARHGADTTEQYNAYEMIEDIVINGTGDAKWVTVDGESILDTPVYLGMDFDDVMDEAVASGTVYFYDFLDDLNDYLDEDYDESDVEKALDADYEAETSRNTAALLQVNIGKNGLPFETESGDKKSIRRAVVDAFEEFIDTTSFDAADYTIEKDDGVDIYKVEDLLEDLAAAAKDEAYLDMYTSELVYLMQEYARITEAEYAVLKDVDNTDWADLLVAILEGRNEEDFKTTKAYRGWTADLEDLVEAYEDADTVGEFAAAVEDLYDEVVTKPTDAEKADLAELTATIDTTILTNWELYPIADFVDKDSDLFVTVTEEGEKVTYEVTEEYYWYNRVLGLAKEMAGNKKSNYQGSIDVITEALADAEAALVPTTEPKPSRLLSLEEWVDANDDLIEMDYKAAAWAKYTTALDHAEAILTGDPGANQTMDAVEMIWYIDELMNKCDYPDAVNPNHVKVKASQVKEMKAAIKEANAWLKKYDDTAAVSKVLAVTKAVKNAEAVMTDYDANKCVLLSKFLGAIDAIDAALASPAVANGWLKTTDGWMYGTETGYTTGWAKIGAVYYYFNEDGIASESKWEYLNGKWYYFTSGCNAVAANWALIDGTWYYFNEDCSMVANGWKWINNKCYYFYASGAMAANTTIDGYVVGADGAWIA